MNRAIQILNICAALFLGLFFIMLGMRNTAGSLIVVGLGIFVFAGFEWRYARKKSRAVLFLLSIVWAVFYFAAFYVLAAAFAIGAALGGAKVPGNALLLLLFPCVLNLLRAATTLLRK